MEKHEKTCGSYLDGSPCFPEGQQCLPPGRGHVWLSAVQQAGQRGHFEGILKSCNCFESPVILAHLKLSQALIAGLDGEKIRNASSRECGLCCAPQVVLYHGQLSVGGSKSIPVAIVMFIKGL